MSRPAELVSRPVLRWLLSAQVLVLLPLAPQLPPWLLALLVFTGVWRWCIAAQGWRYPGKLMRLLLVLLVCAGLLWGFRSGPNLQAMLSLLVAGFVLKLVELRRSRDVYLWCYLAYFVTATQFLFAGSLPSSLYGLLSLLAVTGVLLTANAGLAPRSLWSRCRQLMGLSLQALPIMLLLFFLLPRLGALWSVPLNQSAGVTGVSDSMAPGDFSQLMRSGELAFRVRFSGQTPPARDLYWRGLVFDAFDGRRWSQSDYQQVRRGSAGQPWSDWREALQLNSPAVRYQVLLEPTAKNWLYGLAAFVEVPPESKVSPGLTLYQQRPVNQRRQYQVSSVLDYQLQPEGLSSQQRALYTRLPARFNPQTRRRAQQWRSALSSEAALIERLLAYYHQRFRYTLQPPTLGRHSVDEFLWQSQAGFCEHFAGSFVFFMRAAGIPARVVVGYQGGQLNPEQQYLAVRQYDAHAWAEVWLAGRGWVRVDPTAAVAPERIEQGVEHSLSDDDTQLLGNSLSRQFAWLARAQMRWDALNYRWQLWVMGYDKAAQQAFLSRWLGGVAPWQIMLLLLGGVALVMGVLLLPLRAKRKPAGRPAERAYARACRALAAQGVVRQAGESAPAFAARVARLRPDIAPQFTVLSELFEQALYAHSSGALTRLERAVKRFKPRRAPRSNT
jgi:transglutaminase-like putative cysteine protease